jgi:hypothetical protein
MRPREPTVIKYSGLIGANNHNWKGGISINHGYRYIRKPDYPFPDARGYVAEHRLVFEEYYKCCLLPWTHVHHINEDKLDNRIENLKPVTVSQHNKVHHIGTKHSQETKKKMSLSRQKIWDRLKAIQ